MVKTAIIGVSGYTGLELIKILSAHKHFSIQYLGAREEEEIVNIHPSLKNIPNISSLKTSIIDIKEIKKQCQLVFLATPHTTSMQYVKALSKEIQDGSIKVVDLSADYRLSLDTYEKYYTSHIDKDNLNYVAYGLPEFYKNEIKNANLVANPGCYPTASLLGILPFCDALDESRDIIIDAKSGVSGAGKNPNDIKHFVSANENALIYSVMSHRHAPEIKEKIQLIGKKKSNIIFVPTLMPITRGMQCNIYMYLKKDINAKSVLEKCYKNEKFIRIFDNPVSLKNACGTNFCDIFIKQEKNFLFISTNIDNLLRGASSQAVVNANIMHGFDDDLYVPKISYMP